MSRIEVPVNRHLGDLAPAVGKAASAVIAGMSLRGFKCVPFDTLRTEDRQACLYGKGRTPEQCIEVGISAYWANLREPVVTKTMLSWHRLGLACDFIENDSTPWTASQPFWHALGDLCVTHGLTWGGSWTRFPDLPHGQWAKCPTSPSADDFALLRTQGLPAVWQKYHAT